LLKFGDKEAFQAQDLICPLINPQFSSQEHFIVIFNFLDGNTVVEKVRNEIMQIFPRGRGSNSKLVQLSSCVHKPAVQFFISFVDLSLRF